MDSMDPLLIERAARIRLLALDVDGVLTDGRLYFDDQGREMKAFCTRDGLGLASLGRFGIQLALISGRASAIVERRAAELGIPHLYQGIDDKLGALEDLLARTGVAADQVCYAGDDWIDLPVLRIVGLSVAVADADPDVRQHVHWVTRNRGGHGAVREICNLIMQAQSPDRSPLEEILGQ